MLPTYRLGIVSPRYQRRQHGFTVRVDPLSHRPSHRLLTVQDLSWREIVIHLPLITRNPPSHQFPADYLRRLLECFAPFDCLMPNWVLLINEYTDTRWGGGAWHCQTITNSLLLLNFDIHIMPSSHLAFSYSHPLLSLNTHFFDRPESCLIKIIAISETMEQTANHSG